MCAIIGWTGMLPTGLLYQLLYAGEHRGKDSTGIAYWDAETKHNMLVKQAVTPTVFARVNSEHVSNAQRALRGIAHTRRASKGMPINNASAHPFIYKSHVFCHNGKVRNWEELKAATSAKLTQDVKSNPDLKYTLDYINNVTTDTMILGPAIETLDFSPAIGSIGLAWLVAEKLYAFHSMKELTSATVDWNYEGSTERHTLSLLASTWEMIDTSLQALKNVRFTAKETILKENVLYELTADAVVDSGPVPVNKANEIDLFSSFSSAAENT